MSRANVLLLLCLLWVTRLASQIKRGWPLPDLVCRLGLGLWSWLNIRLEFIFICINVHVTRTGPQICRSDPSAVKVGETGLPRLMNDRSIKTYCRCTRQMTCDSNWSTNLTLRPMCRQCGRDWAAPTTCDRSIKTYCGCTQQVTCRCMFDKAKSNPSQAQVKPKSNNTGRSEGQIRLKSSPSQTDSAWTWA